MQDETGYGPALERTRWGTEKLDELSMHLPSVDVTASSRGLSYQVRCSCGTTTSSEETMMRAGREFDQHIAAL